MLRIAFIGGGRVAATLAPAFHKAGHQVVAIYGRHPGRTAAVAARAPGAVVSETAQLAADGAELVFLTVTDDAIAPVCASVRWRRGQLVAHCSGATERVALRPASEAGALVGAFHPLQMFADPDTALEGLPGCTITIDADPALADLLEPLVRDLGCRAVRLDPGQRAIYHASVNYVGPFLIALMREASAMWRTFGASEQEALDALVPLLRGTVAAVLKSGLAGGMGGCVARGDVGTVERHLAALDAFSPDAGALYRALSARTIPLGLERGTLSEEKAAAIARALTAAPASAEFRTKNAEG